MPYAYPLFLILVLFFCCKIIYNETGLDPYSLNSYNEARARYKKELKKRYKIRREKERHNKMINVIRKKNKNGNERKDK